MSWRDRLSSAYDVLTGKQQVNVVLDQELAQANINGLVYGTPGSGEVGKIPVTVYNPSVLLSRKGYSVIDNMRRDSQVKVALAYKKHAIMSAGWNINSPEGKQENWDILVFVRSVLNDLPGTFNRRLYNILSAIDYGFSVTEPIWTKRPDGYIGYKTLKTRKPHDFTFDSDPFGNVTLLRQANRPLPPSRFIVYSFVDEFENPYGTSELESAYTPWWLKDNAYKFLAILLERLGIPPVFASYNRQVFAKPEDKRTIQTIVSKMQTGTAATFPRSDNKDDITFWAPEIAGQASTVFIPALQHADQDIAKAILMPSLLGGTSDKETGSYARSKTHFDAFLLIVEALRREIEDLVNEKIIKPLVDVNFSTDEYPEFNFNPIETSDENSLFDTWYKLVTGKVVSQQPEDEAFIREQLDFPPVSDEAAAEAVRGEANVPGPQPGAQNDGAKLTPVPADNKTFALSRKPNSYESRVDFAQISADLDALDAAAITSLKTAYSGVQEALTNYVRINYDKGPAMADGVELRKLASVRSAFVDMVNIAYAKGHAAITDELHVKPFRQSASGFTPAEADQYLKQKALTSYTTVNDRLLAGVKTALLQAIRGQRSTGEAIDAVSRIFDPYVSDSPAYAETVVRTNTIDAYNQGRLMAIRDPDVAEYIQGVEYSAILDSRTTELCRHLDGRVFKVGDPMLDRLTPPNHFNCRSVLVPVMIDQPKPDYISAADAGKAVDMAGSFA